METLENRCLLAVSAFVDEGVLNVTGDDTNDEIRVTLLRSTYAKIEGLGATTINGASEASFSYARYVAVDLGGGEDAVTLDSVLIRGKTRIHLGEDDDTLTVIDSIFHGKPFADGGLGDDLLTLLGDNLLLAGRKAKNFETIIQ